MKKTNAQLDADLQMKEKDVTRLFNKRIIHIDVLKKDTRYLIPRKDGKKMRNPWYMKQRTLNSLLKSDSEEASELGHYDQIDEIDADGSPEVDKLQANQCNEENLLNSKDSKFLASREVQTEMVEYSNRESMTEIHMEDRVSSYIQTDEKIRRSFLRDVAVGRDIRVYMGYIRCASVNLYPTVQTQISNTEVIVQEEATVKRVKKTTKRKSDSSKKKSGKRALKLPKISAHQVSQETETEPQDIPQSGPLIDPTPDSIQNLGYLDTEVSLNSAYFNKKPDTTFVEIATQVSGEGMRGYDPDIEDAQILDIISSHYSKSTSPRSTHLAEMSISKENLYEIAEEDNERFGQDSQRIEDYTQAKLISQGYDISKMELIPAGADVPSWYAGFNTGFEQGKTEAEKMLRETEKDSVKNSTNSDSYETEDNERKLTRSSSIKQSNAASFARERSRVSSVLLPQDDSYLNPIRKESKFTKTIGFLFSRLLKPKKSDPSWKIIDSIMIIPLDQLQQTPNKMPKRLLYKLISYLQQSLLIKYKAGEKLKSLSSISYKEFIQKYGLKQVAESKYKSFVISLLLAKNSRRIGVFCRLFGIGHKIGLVNFSVHTFRFYIDCFACIIHSKLGVVTNIDETADIQMIPTLRALECVQEKGSQFLHNDDLERIVSSLQISSVPDPKKANPTGIIDQELLLEMLANEFENYQEDVKTVISGINDCLALCPHAKYISKNSLILMIRYIMPHSTEKFLDIGEDSTETLKPEVTKYVGYVNSDEEKVENLDSEPEDLLLLTKIVSYIIKNTAIKRGDYEKFLKLRDASKLNSEINRCKIECFDLIAQIQLLRRDFDSENWRSKLNNLQESMSEFENIYILGTLKIWREEILKYHIVNT
jgi:hypothetical protein